MDGTISCCGVDCGSCSYYPSDCAGCNAIGGRVFWLAYTGGDVCDIYRCCVLEKGHPHCGQCAELPCHRYDQKDPTRSDEENEAEFLKQMTTLAVLRQAEEKNP